MKDKHRADLVRLFKNLENARLELEDALDEYKDEGDIVNEDAEEAYEIVAGEIENKITEAADFLGIKSEEL